MSNRTPAMHEHFAPPGAPPAPDDAPIRLTRAVDAALPIARARAEVMRAMRAAHERGDVDEVYRLAGRLTGRTPLSTPD